MSNDHDLAESAAAILFQKAEVRFNALLAEHSGMQVEQLPQSVSREILRRALVDTAATDFPCADLDALSHGIQSFTHPAFCAALEQMKLSKKSSNVFEPARGVDSAIVLAGLGLPVAPYDLETARTLEKPSRDIDAVIALFSRDKTAFVGYDVCNAPFYLFMTDCTRTLLQRVPRDTAMFELKVLFERGDGAAWPPDHGRNFQPFMGLFPRRPGDTISTVAADAGATSGLIVLCAGWEVDGEPHGASSDGYLPVPLCLLHAAIDEPELARVFWYSVRAPEPIQ
jgi:hypothetical protein